MTQNILPRYYQIKQIIKKWILNNEIGINEKIPSENELSLQFKSSRVTVRQALAELVQEGFLIRKRGDATYVADNKKLINSYSIELTGFMNELFYHISRSKTKSAKIERIKPTRTVRRKLMLPEEENEVIKIERLRFIDGSTFAHTTAYFPLKIGESITVEVLLKKPLLQIIEEDLNIRLNESYQVHEASFAHEELAKKLKVPRGSPILFVEQIQYAGKKEPIVFVQTSYRGDLYKYIIRLKRVAINRKKVWIPDVQ
jgi:GntR family transcriptional regulator